MTDDAATPDDDELLDRIDQGVPPATPEEAAARAPYERLLARVRALPPVAPLPGWEERAAQRWRFAHQRRRWIPISAGVVALAAAAALFVALRPGGPTATDDRLAMTVTPPDGIRRAGVAAVGSTLQLRVARPAVHRELRVYRPDLVVVRCPGASTCRETDRELTLELTLDVPGLYRPMVLSAATPIPAPGTGGLDADVLSAREAGATIRTLETVRVGR